MIKHSLKRIANLFGYEIKQIAGPPAWPKPDTTPQQDEVIKGPWQGQVLQMANRTYQPKELYYHRTRFGDDHRLKYMTHFLDLRDLRVLEMGPLEGHHSVIIEKMGARENIAIESRDDNLAKCQRIKQKYGLDRTTFLRGDIEKLSDGRERPQFSGRFDIIFCVGVLYHLPEPAKALAWFASQADVLFLGTHYTEPNEKADATYDHNGKTYRGKTFREDGIENPISGMSPTSLWPYEGDLIKMIKDAGYSRVSVLGRDLLNNTPHITVLADMGRKRV